MEENKGKKKNISVVVCIVSVLVVLICVCGVFMYKNFTNEKIQVTESKNLVKKVNSSVSYGEFVLTEQKVSKEKQLIIEKDGKEIYTMELTAPESIDSKYYADWNNSNEKCLRVRIDNYPKYSEVRSGYTWYIFDENGNLIEKNDYIQNSVYEDEKEYGKYKILLTSDNYLIVYVPIENDTCPAGKIVSKLRINVNKDVLKDQELLNKNGTGYYADWNASNKNCLRVRIDNFEKDFGKRYSYTWYVIDENENLVSETEYIESSLYEDTKEYGKYRILITRDNMLALVKPLAEYDNEIKVVVKKFNYYVDEKHLNDEKWVNKNGPGYYADWNNANEGNIRIRINQYNKSYSNRIKYTWYIIDGEGNIIDETEHIDGFDDSLNSIEDLVKDESYTVDIYENETNEITLDRFSSYAFDEESGWSKTGGEVKTEINDGEDSEFEQVIVTKEYGNFRIDITSKLYMKIYIIEDGKERIIGTIKMSIPREKIGDRSSGNGYYADWNNALKRCLRVRVDNYNKGSGYVQGCYWYYFDETGKQITLDEYQSINEK